MLKQADLKVTNLLLDSDNPRMPSGKQSQPETILALLHAEGTKTLALAQSIAIEGLSPIDRLIVMPAPTDSSRFIVLEGNRRVTALKILAEPALAEGILTPVQIKNLRKWGTDYRARGMTEIVPCAVFATRAEADVWIERRHRGDQGGLGVVRWGATESARFDARRTGKRSPELQVLDFVSDRGNLDAETMDKLHNVSITNLKRLIRDKQVRTAIGIKLDPDGKVSTHFPEKEVLKGLIRIVRDLAHETIKVADIYHAKDRKDYLSRFKASERPSQVTNLPDPHSLSGVTPGIGLTAGTSDSISRRTQIPKTRATLIPNFSSCNVKGAKLRNIYIELRRLKLEEYPNAISVLFRVFLELSVDDVIEKQQLMTAEQAAGSKLRDKLTKVADHLESARRLTNQQARAVKKVANDQHLIAGSVTTFHQYVHNKELAASPTDLRTTWDNLEPLFQALWPGTTP